MPDLAWYDRQNRHLLSIERRYLKAARSPLEDTRKEALDRVVTLGVDNPAIQPELQRLYNALGYELALLGVDPASDLVGATATGATAQLAQAGLPALDTLRDPVAEQRATQELRNGQPAWLAAQQAAQLAEIGRLRLAGTPTDQAALELYGRGIQNGRASTWHKGLLAFDLSTSTVIWGASAALVSVWAAHGQTQTGERWEKQAVAAIDEKTTDCCLNVTGQVQRLDADFHLVGTPRYADYMKRPPFHWRCRTALSLYSKRVEQVGVSTAQIRAAARAELRAREKSGRQEIHPAHATSTRGK